LKWDEATLWTVEVTVIFDEVNFLGCLKPENGAADILAASHN
jgi:hypothetical protein